MYYILHREISTPNLHRQISNYMLLDALLTWARAHGSKISPCVSFKSVGDNNFGAVSEPGPISISVPAELIIGIPAAIASFGPEFAEISKKTRNVNAILKLFLARERSSAVLPSSFYKAYIESLPTTVNSPYVWLAEDQKLLGGTNLGSSLRDNLTEIIEEWWLVVSILPDMTLPELHYVAMKFYYEHRFYTAEQMHQYLTCVDVDAWTSFPAYLWAAMIIKLRSFPAYLLEGENGGARDAAMLVPVIDLLNHSPTAKVSWAVGDGVFRLETDAPGGEVFNNYGQKGNEELLLAYGFCLEANPADLVALKIRVPEQVWPVLKENVELPTIADYTTSVVQTGTDDEKKTLEPNSASGTDRDLLFFVSKDRIPANLIDTFQWLVRSAWETTPTLRMRLSGLNHLRQALESKSSLLDQSLALSLSSTSENATAVRIYVKGQKKLLDGGAKLAKRMEKEILAEHKSKLVSLKSVYKRDGPFARSLLVTMGVSSYEDIINGQLLDQVWLLYLIRCYNRNEYHNEDDYLPEWIASCFARMDSETVVEAAEVLQFRELYENVILPMNAAVPEIYNVGKWTVRELIVSTRVLDTIGFVRGREQECILVNDFE